MTSRQEILRLFLEYRIAETGLAMDRRRLAVTTRGEKVKAAFREAIKSRQLRKEALAARIEQALQESGGR